MHTHSSEHTHTPWTHTRSSGQTLLRRPGSSWGVGALLKGLTSVVVLRVERALHIHYNSCQYRESNPQPLGYESDSLTVRPRLPLDPLVSHDSSEIILIWWFAVQETLKTVVQLHIFVLTIFAGSFMNKKFKITAFIWHKYLVTL